MKFVDRSPEQIHISDQPLREVLQDQGEFGVIRLREFLRKQDWSGFEKRYQGGGRPAYHPSAVLGLVLWGLLQGVDSLRGLERLGKQNIACWWLTGGQYPDHSQLGRFIQRHSEELSEKFFEEITRRVLSELGLSGRRVAGDGTGMQAAASAYKQIREEAAREAVHQASPGQEKEQAQRVLDQLQERQRSRTRVGASKDKRIALSPQEPEAVIQPLPGSRAVPAYKGNVLSNEQQVIVAAQVEASSEPEALEKMLEQTTRVSPDRVEHLLLDGNYFKGSVFQACRTHAVQVWTPPRKVSAQDRYHKSRFGYDRSRDAYLCPQGQWLHRFARGMDRGQRLVRYASSQCAHCPVRAQCTRGKTGRQIVRYEDEAYRESIRERMRSEAGQRYYRKRKAWVEPVFAVLKTRQGFRRFRRKGLAKVRLEWALHASAYNLGKWLSLASPSPTLFRFLKALSRPVGEPRSPSLGRLA